MQNLLPVLGAPATPIAYPNTPSFAGGGAKVWKFSGVAAGGGGNTYCGLAPAEAPFTGGYLYFVNAGTTPIRITSVCVAPTAIENNGYSPVDAGGNAVAWTVLSGGPWFVPPGKSVFAPGILKIPFSVASITRGDFPSYCPLLMFRAYAADAIYSGSMSALQLDMQRLAYSAKRPWNGFYKSGNFAASNQAGITSPTRQFLACIGVEFTHAVVTKSVADVGDSTTQGATSKIVVASTATTAAVSASTSIPVADITNIVAGQIITGNGIAITSSVSVSSVTPATTGATTGAGTLVASANVTLANNVALSFSSVHDCNGPLAQWQNGVSTPSNPVYAYNLGVQGYTVSGFVAVADAWLRGGFAPNVLLLQVWSSNYTTGNQNGCDAEYLVARDFALKCQRSGIRVVLKTPKPAALSAGSDLIRKNIVARVKSDIFPYIDCDAAMSDGATPAKLSANAASSDGVHSSNSGYGYEMSNSYVSILNALLGVTGVPGHCDGTQFTYDSTTAYTFDQAI